MWLCHFQKCFCPFVLLSLCVTNKIVPSQQSGFATPRSSETSHVSFDGSKHYLPTLRTAVTTLFSVFFGPLEF